MSHPKPDEQPTTVLPQQTAEQPGVSTAPPTRRTGLRHHLPARIGRARTSTVVVGALFVLLFALHAAVAPDPVAYTDIVDANTGQTVRVPQSLVPPAPTTTPAPTTQAPTSTPASSASRAPGSSDGDETTPATSSRAPGSTSTPAPTTSRAPATSRSPSTSATPSSSDAPDESSSAPTS